MPIQRLAYLLYFQLDQLRVMLLYALSYYLPSYNSIAQPFNNCLARIKKAASLSHSNIPAIYLKLELPHTLLMSFYKDQKKSLCMRNNQRKRSNTKSWKRPLWQSGWRLARGKPGRRAAGATPGKINNSFAPWQGRWICRQIRRPFRTRFFGGFTRGCAYRSAVKLAPG